VAALLPPLLLLLLAAGPPGLRAQGGPTETAAREFLQKFDVEASQLMYQYSLASWDYNTNITEENAKKVVRGGPGGGAGGPGPAHCSSVRLACRGVAGSHVVSCTSDCVLLYNATVLAKEIFLRLT